MKKLLLLIIILIFGVETYAGHIMGSEVTYRYIGGMKYEITLKYYRDCRGIPFNSPSVEMYGIGSSSSLKKSLSITRVSITDLSYNCSKMGKQCNPANTTISSSSAATEMHTYLDTVDFEKADSAFKKFCYISFGTGQCCRNGAITTGAASSDFWVYSELNLCDAPKNSSPYFSSTPYNILCCNQPVYSNLGAIDTINFDSLSYDFVEPLTSWTGKVTFSGPYSYKSPLTAYWPSGYDKNKGPKPDANPPIGIYLDPETGDFIFTPTDCSEVTAFTIRVSEWRKNKSGAYVKIGEIRRDLQYIVQTCPSNNPPTLNGPNKYSVCAGQQLCFNVTTDDKQYIPPPPAKADPPDSVSLTWNKGINRGATFTIVNKQARLQSAKFCWTPNDSNVSDLPYTFMATARDNHCSLNGISTKSYQVFVRPAAKAKRKYTALGNGLFEFKSEIDSGFKGIAKYNWFIMDSAMRVADTSQLDYNRVVGGQKFRNALDSFQFLKPGKYIIQHNINNFYNCATTYFDTLFVDAISPFLQVGPQSSSIYYVCQNTKHTLKPTIVNAVNPVKFRWSTSSTDTLSSLDVNVLKDTSFTVYVSDTKGYKRSKTWYFYLNQTPIVTASADKMLCVGDSTILTAQATNYTDTAYWKWFYDGKQIGDQAQVKAKKSGIYTVEVTDFNQCTSSLDTVIFSNFRVKVLLGNDVNVCSGSKISLKANDSAGSKVNTYQWYEIRNSKLDTLVSKTDSLVLTPNAAKLFWVLQTSSLGTLKCRDTDTLQISVLALPQIKLGDARICQNELELDMNSLILKPTDVSKGVLSWKLLKTLPKPAGGNNSLKDIVYDKDPGTPIKYFLKVDESVVKIPGNFKDSLIFGLSYKDEFGCENGSTDSSSVLIKTNIAVSFVNKEISVCYGDSVKQMSNAFGVNFYGGVWYTENDSNKYSAWPQGDQKVIAENNSTNFLSKKSTKYLAKYVLSNNDCESINHSVINIVEFPSIQWSQVNEKDSILFSDETSNASKREWYLDGSLYSSAKSIKLSNFIAFSKTIRLNVFTGSCESDSTLIPQSIGIKPLHSENWIELFPNPANMFVYFNFSTNETFNLNVINTLGQVVLNVESVKNGDKIMINELKKGVYSFVFSSANHHLNAKLIKE